MHYCESGYDFLSRIINPLSGWKRMDTTRPLHWANQANWRAGHVEFVLNPMVEMTWMEIYEMKFIFWTVDKDMKVDMRGS